MCTTSKNEEKLKKRKERAFKRSKARMEKYVSKIQAARNIDDYRVPLSSLDSNGYGYFCGQSWRDSNSPTGYSQVCSYQGICQAPCNGDC